MPQVRALLMIAHMHMAAWHMHCLPTTELALSD